MPVLEIGPGRAVGERIGVHRGRDVQGRPHALAEVAIPGRAACRAGCRPTSTAEAPSDWCRCRRRGWRTWRLRAAICMSALRASFRPRICAGSVLGPDDDEIVVHHVAAIDAEAVGDELVLADAIMHQERIGVAARADRKRLSGADRDDVHAQAGRGVEDRQDVLEQAGVLGRGGRAENDEALRRPGRSLRSGPTKAGRKFESFRHSWHRSPAM